MKNLPLTATDINTLFDLSESYMVPTHQDHVVRKGLVLYNTVNRVMALEEAEKMEESLSKAGFETMMKEWTTTFSLRQEFMDELKDCKDKLSLLLVCIMSHGRVGRIAGAENTEIPISDIIELLDNILPKKVPLVSASQE